MFADVRSADDVVAFEGSCTGGLCGTGDKSKQQQQNQEEAKAEAKAEEAQKKEDAKAEAKAAEAKKEEEAKAEAKAEAEGAPPLFPAPPGGCRRRHYSAGNGKCGQCLTTLSHPFPSCQESARGH